MHKKTTITMIFLTSFILLGCKSIKANVIIDDSCPPPCWKEIEPGKTTKQEAVSILTKLAEVKQSSINTWSIVNSNDSVQWKFLPRTGAKYGNIFIDNNIVFGLRFSPDNTLALEEAIKHLGSPESILTLYHHEEIPFVSIFVAYPTKGIVLSLSINPYHIGEPVNITSDMNVEVVWYFNPDLYAKLMESNYIAGVDSNILIKGSRPWPGYGNITEFILEEK